jgi:penicillin-binding protein 1A
VLRTTIKAIAVFVLSALVVPAAVGATVLAVFLFMPLPATLPEKKALVESRPSTILDINGQPIGQFRKFDTNIPFTKDDVPAVLKHAVIAAEDKNFYKHGGVDVRGTVRAFWRDYQNKQVVQGGSTITQQYVKKAYVGEERTLTRKVREAVLASQLDRQFEKDDILYNYLAILFLGNGAYGVQAASNLYFRKNVKDLNPSEAAMLAGLIPAPSRYEPLGNPNLAEEKRRIVLRKMHEQGYLSDADFATYFSQGLWYAASGPPPGPATLVYAPQRAENQFPYFVDYVEKYLYDRYGDRLYTGGLKIQTTLDPDIQRAAEASVAKQLAGTKPPLEMSLVAVEPPTGYVKALVGGRDFAQSQVNLALGGCPVQRADVPIEVRADCWDHPDDTVGGGGTGRQPGSSFKPFTLATALTQGMSPEKVYSAPRTYLPKACHGRVSASCKPIGNNEGEGGGAETLRQATALSVNTVYAQVIEDVGVKNVAEMARKLGITSAWFSPRVHGISYTLGVIDVSPLDMASAYGVFANSGKRVPPTPVLKVVDAQNHVLEDHTKPQGEQVLDANVANNVTDLLRGVIDHGTATRANIGRPAAGKTGTGQNYTNAWFVGYTPTLSTSVWMGYSDNQKTPLLRIKGVGRVYGGTLPAQTWHDFMLDALKDVPVTDFNEPAPIKPVQDQLKRQARQGIDPGPRRNPVGTPTDCGGPCEQRSSQPIRIAPPTTVATAPPGPTP